MGKKEKERARLGRNGSCTHAETCRESMEKEAKRHRHPQLVLVNLKRAVWPEHEKGRNGEAKRGRKGT